MISTRLPARLRGFRLPKFVWALAAAILLAVAPLSIAQNPAAPKNEESVSSSTVPNAQAAVSAAKQEPPESSSGEKARADAAELAELANQLRDQLHRTDFNILSLNIIQKTEAIEKLAKKIKGESHER
jgi:hypothetical protein